MRKVIQATEIIREKENRSCVVQAREEGMRGTLPSMNSPVITTLSTHKYNANKGEKRINE